MNERLTMVAAAEPYVGKYFSQDYLRRKILRQTDEEILEQDKIMKKEIKDGTIPDPDEMMIDPNTGQPMPAGMDLGQPVMEPDVNLRGADVNADAMEQEADIVKPRGGEI